MKRLCASLCCPALVFAALAHATAFAADATGDRASVVALASSSTGDGRPIPASIDRPGCAEEADGDAGACAIDAVISPLRPLASASARGLPGGREAAPPLKMSALAPEPPPPIALP